MDLKEREAFLAAWMIGTKLLHRRLEKSFKKTIHYFEHTRAGWVYEDLLLWDAIINKNLIMEFFFLCGHPFIGSFCSLYPDGRFALKGRKGEERPRAPRGKHFGCEMKNKNFELHLDPGTRGHDGWRQAFSPLHLTFPPITITQKTPEYHLLAFFGRDCYLPNALYVSVV